MKELNRNRVIYLAILALCCFAVGGLSSSDIKTYAVEVCAESERKAVEEATAQCIHNAGRQCRCTCEKSGTSCEGSKAMWCCGCSRMISDNW